MAAKEFSIGNTKIIINDMYCREQTEEERRQILKRVSDIAYGALLRQMEKQASA